MFKYISLPLWYHLYFTLLERDLKICAQSEVTIKVSFVDWVGYFSVAGASDTETMSFGFYWNMDGKLLSY